MTTLAFALSRALARETTPGDEVVVTELDHDANIWPWLTLQEHGAVVRQVPVMPDATLDLGTFRELIGERTRLVAVGLASNAVGTVTDVAAVRGWARAAGARLVVDAVHAVPHLVTDVAALDPDFLFCSAYKFFGPHVGVLYARPGALARLRTDKVRSQRDSAPERIETGTLNHAALAGVPPAVEFIASLGPGGGSLRERVVAGMSAIYDGEHLLVRRLAEGLAALDGVRLYGPPVDGRLRAPTIAFTVAGVHPDDVARRLGRQQVAVWSGNFYASTLVERLGLAASGGLVRAGIAPYTTEEEVDRLVAAVAGLTVGQPVAR